MKKFYLAVILVLFCLTSNAQSPPPWEWVKQGGSTSDENSGRCARDINNNVYAVGQFQGVATFGSNTLTSNGGNDAFIAKYDSSGVLLWIKQIGGSGEDDCYNIRVDSAGTNLYVTGWYTGTVLFDATSVPSHGPQDAFIAKYDSSGAIQWVRHGGSASEVSRGLGIAIDRSQQFVYATGHCGINSSFDATTFTNPYHDVFLAKYNTSNGALVWAKHAGGPSDDGGESVVVDHLGNAYVTGWCKSTATFDAFPITNTGANHSNFLAKYDTGGNVIWATASYGVGSGGTSVAIDSSDSKVYVLGEINIGSTYYDTDTIVSYGSTDITLALYDSSGAYNWVKHFGSTGTEWAGEVTLDKWSNIYISGTFSNTASFIDTSINSVGDKDAFIAKLNPSGTVLWAEQAGGAGEDNGIGLSINKDGSVIYFCGNFTGPANFGSFVQNGYGNKDVYVAKLAAPHFSECINLTLQPDSTAGKDAYLCSAPGLGNNNYGDSHEFTAGAWTWSGNPGTVRCLIQFDLSSIPANAIINSAHLSLYAVDSLTGLGHHSTLSGPNDAWLERITQSWSEYSVTWNNQPATTIQNRVNLPSSTSLHEDYPNIDVTALLQDMVGNPGSSYGFMFELDTETYYRSMNFCSTDHPDQSKHPKLEICYTVPNQNCVDFVGPSSTTHAYFDSYSSNNNDHTGTTIQSATWTALGNPMIQRSVVEFDLTSIPSTATVDSASLYLYADPTNPQGGHYGTGNSGWLRRITQAWNPNTITWNSQPTYNATNEVNIPAPLSQQQDYVLDVSAMVQDMVTNPSSNFGFLLMMQDEVNTYKSLIFCSSDYPDSARFPKLKVCYKFGPENISENHGKNSLTIYPNPSNGSFIVAFQNPMRNGTIEVFNSLGQEIYNRNISSSGKEEINLNAAAGIYFVKIFDGENSVTKKLVIQ